MTNLSNELLVEKIEKAYKTYFESVGIRGQIEAQLEVVKKYDKEAVPYWEELLANAMDVEADSLAIMSDTVGLVAVQSIFGL